MTKGIFHDFFAGWISGSAGVIIGHPIDTVKVQLQIQSKENLYRNVGDCVTTIKKQSLSKGFFRGLSGPVVSAGLINSVFFGVYSQVLKLMGTNPEKQHDHPDYIKIMVASGFSGVVQLMVACPIEVIKVVLQSQIPHGKHSGRFYHGPFESIKHIVQQNGVQGVYRGFNVQLPRDVIASAMYFTVFEFMSYEGNNKLESVPRWLVNFVSGGIAGIISWAAIIPFDVMKSRIQADYDKKLYKNFWDCAVKTYTDNGVKAFFRGGSLICLRAFPVNAVTLMVYAEYMKIFDAKFLP